MIGKEIKCIMTKYTNVPASGDVEPHVQFILKHTNVGDVQTLMGYFEKALDTTNIQSLFNYPVRWSKQEIDVSDYQPNYYLIEFDEVEINAKLQKIVITRKLDEGIDSFDYTFHFKKEMEEQDVKIAYIYPKHKEENEDGKKILVEYSTTINIAQEPTDTSTNADIL